MPFLSGVIFHNFHTKNAKIFYIYGIKTLFYLFLSEKYISLHRSFLITIIKYNLNLLLCLTLHPE